MPVLFVGHGNPMNAVEDNNYTAIWKEIGTKLPPPKAIVCMSAHWLTEGSFITSTLRPEIIYDFYGFPEKLYHVPYPAMGEPQIASKIHSLDPRIDIDRNWGLDHGTWSFLIHMFPKANVPVLQLSIDYYSPPTNQFELMVKLRKLRNDGILFIGSGNIVHNLAMASNDVPPYEWATEFEKQSQELIAKGDTKALIDYRKLGTAANMSIPTDDHYRPMLNTLALRYSGESPEFFNAGIDLASVSMLSFKYS